MKTFLIYASAVGVAVLLASVARSAVGGDASAATREVTKHVHARTTTFVEIDNGRRGESAGDLLTFTHLLSDRTTTRRVGRAQGHCVRILRNGASDCTMTTFLEDGQITVVGPLHEGTSRLAITGGTAAYGRARGWVEVRRTGFFEFDLRYKLSLG